MGTAMFLLALTTASSAAAVAPSKFNENASIEEQRRYFTEDDAAPQVKPAHYDVTIVEYMDYQCPYCRATHGPLKELLASDHKIHVIFRDWPVFGPESQHAALIAVASKYQGKYLAVHNALMETPLPLTHAKIKAAAIKAGVNWQQLQHDMAAHADEITDLFERNEAQASMLGLEGTPGFIIGDVQSFGGMTLKQLRQSVAEARKQGNAGSAESAQGK